MSAPIHAKVLSLHSKGNKAVLGQLHETNLSSKSINGNVVGVEYKISDVGKNCVTWYVGSYWKLDRMSRRHYM